MVEAYGGFVRCGNCNYKFNIHDQVSPEPYQDDIQGKKEPQFDLDEEPSSQNTQRIEPKIDAETDDDSLNIRFRELEDEYAADIAYEPVLKSELEAFDDALALQESAPVFTSITEIDIESDEIDLSEDEDFDSDSEPIQEPLDSLASEALLTPENLDAFDLDSESLIDNLMEQASSPDYESSELAQTVDLNDLTDDWQDELSSEDDLRQADVLDDETDALADLFDNADDVIQEDKPDEPLTNNDPEDLLDDWQTDNEFDDDLTQPDVLDDETDSLADLFDEAEDIVEEVDDTASRPIIFDLDADDEYEDDSRQAPRIPTLINNEAESTASAKSFGLVSAFTRMLMFVFWTAISIALVYFLFSQIKDKLYPGYINHPIVQSIRTSVCGYLPCSETKYDTQAYEIVVSRMDEIGEPERELHISIFMMNKSNIAQVYPQILITLKRLDGSIAGQRAITPDEYFKSHDSFVDGGDKASAETQIIKPNKLGKVLIKLGNPPVDAVGFEARVVN
jgi:hypothetical protein